MTVGDRDHETIIPPSIDVLRDQIRKAESDYAAKDIPLSGRIIHVSHYLPIVASLNHHHPSPTVGVPTPPRTPDRLSPPALDGSSSEQSTTATNETEVPPSDRWSLAPRRGHTAMHSGIHSLSATHEQIMVGWTGEIKVAAPTSTATATPGTSVTSPTTVEQPPAAPSASSLNPPTIPVASISTVDRAALDDAIKSYRDPKDPFTSESSTSTSTAHETPSSSTDVSNIDKPMSYAAVWLSDSTAHAHYEGYCKSTLWPLFHYLLWQDVTTELPVEDTDWLAYVEANQAYADRVAEVAKAGDMIWIHDYHLLLVPRMLRTLLPDAYIGLFVHTPFPSSEIFRCLPSQYPYLLILSIFAPVAFIVNFYFYFPVSDRSHRFTDSMSLSFSPARPPNPNEYPKLMIRFHCRLFRFLTPLDIRSSPPP